jgi:hypothetical protein
MNMMVFSPIFPFLSVLGGIVAGIIMGLLLAVTFVAAYYRDFPFHLIARGMGGIVLIGAAVLISFIVFRVGVGLPNFDLTSSLSHMFIELMRDRVSYLLSGIATGFLAMVATFLGSLASGSSGGSRRKLDHSALRSLMPSWK